MIQTNHIRNFSIIAHIDHGKSTLADRMLELTGTIEHRKMRAQTLDAMDLERERGITIKMTPVRMLWHPRGQTQTDTQTNADNEQGTMPKLLHEDVTYKIRGAAFAVKRSLGLGHKESVYHRALEIEFTRAGLSFESEKTIRISYEGENVGIYVPDFVVENSVLVELKALPEIGRPQERQLWSYLKGSSYHLALLVNFGSTDVTFQRVVYDEARGERGLRESALSPRVSAEIEYQLNLIDTPGHIDFSYEVSRALAACEGAVLLVDATQGVQAQTLSHLETARSLGLTVVPVVNKIDMKEADVPRVTEELCALGFMRDEILAVSAKNGTGVPELLHAIIQRIPPPSNDQSSTRALIFDSVYDEHVGVIAYVRVVSGAFSKGTSAILAFRGTSFAVKDIGYFRPARETASTLSAGEIGYIVIGLKTPDVVRIGDTVMAARDYAAHATALSGYEEPNPVVWASMFPTDEHAYGALGDALRKLKLNDSAVSFQEYTATFLGRGYLCGFLGTLHLEIVAERLRREFGLEFIITAPSVAYHVYRKEIMTTVSSPYLFPRKGEADRVEEPMIRASIIIPEAHLSAVFRLTERFEMDIAETVSFGTGRVIVSATLPLRTFVRDFFSVLSQGTSGFASLRYVLAGYREARLERIDITVNDTPVEALSRVAHPSSAEREARDLVDMLKETLLKEQFEVRIHAMLGGRIAASAKISPMRKDVTGYLYGGDRTRKMKLWAKQKRGKKKLSQKGEVSIPTATFLEILKKSR